MAMKILIALKMPQQIVKSMAVYIIGKQQIMLAQRAGIYQLQKNLKL